MTEKERPFGLPRKGQYSAVLRSCPKLPTCFHWDRCGVPVHNSCSGFGKYRCLRRFTTFTRNGISVQYSFRETSRSALAGRRSVPKNPWNRVSVRICVRICIHRERTATNLVNASATTSDSRSPAMRVSTCGTHTLLPNRLDDDDGAREGIGDHLRVICTPCAERSSVGPQVSPPPSYCNEPLVEENKTSIYVYFVAASYIFCTPPTVTDLALVQRYSIKF